MNYQDYQNARDMSWRILLDCGVCALPVKISGICAALGVAVKRYAPSGDSDGYCHIVNGKPTILVSHLSSPERQRFTAAHELGHILLGHVGRYALVSREPSPNDSPIEQAANVFASRILAPACVLWGLHAHTPEEIMSFCRISYPAAVFRAERMETLYRRDKFLTSALEREVCARFSDYIEAHRL
ncbi:MAG: ImmA/IrrE family metallo-endopeptidase [Oscillospiraceae bacterium]